MKLIAVDANSIMNRAYYGIRLLSNQDGVYTNAILGFMNILLKVVDENPAEAFAFAFDRKEPTFRHEKFEDYKAGRKSMPAELAMQFPLIKELLTDLGYQILETPGFEADDILGTLADVCDQTGDSCMIVTGDRDCFQLVSPRVTVRLATTKGGMPEVQFYDVAAIAEKYGLEPKQLIEVKALMGDASDNIPGVAGVGEKTALALVQKWGTLDQIYENLADPSFKTGVRAKLEAGRDMAYFSRELAEISTKAPVERTLSVYQKGAGDPAAAGALLAKLGMHKLKEKLGLGQTDTLQLTFGAAETEQTPTHTATKIAGLADLPKGEKLCLFVQWDGEEPLAFAVGGKKTIVYMEADQPGFLETVHQILTDEREKTVLDSKHFYHYGFRHGLEIKNLVLDLSLAGYVLNPLEKFYDPDRLLTTYGGVPVMPDNRSPLVDTLASMMAVAEKLASLIAENGQENLLYQIEQPLSRVLASMEITGFDIDEAGVMAFGQKLDSRIGELETTIYEAAGETFNINSPKQMGVILFEKMGLPAKKKTKTGYSTNAEVLEELRPISPIVADILEYRQLAKLKSTYVEGLLKVIGPDGRVHTRFNQTETRTGRISSTEPNMQNIPIRTDLGREMRRFFHAEPGSVLLDADYSQIELRVLAAMADDKAMIQGFADGDDIHQMTAAQVFGVPLQMVTSKMRSDAKAVNFGIVYGISAFSLAQDIGVSVADAKKYIENYLNTYPGVKAFREQQVVLGRENGYAETLFHRRRALPELVSHNFNERSFGERVAVNMPIQGTAADIIKVAMVRVYHRLEKENLRARLILQVHDELIIEAPLAEKDQAAAVLKEEMERAAALSVNMAVDVGQGDNWYDAKA